MPGLSSPGGRGGAKAQMRPGGGFRQSFDTSLSESHQDDAAMQSLGQTKQAAQQSSTLGQQGASKQLAQQQGAGKTALADAGTQEKPARDVSDLKDELFTRPAKDLLETGKSFFDINSLLGINSEDSPEKKAKKKKIADNWQKLNQNEQAFVKQKYEEEMQKKQAAEEEKEAKKQKEEEEKAASIAPPSSPQKGAAGLAGSKKQKASTMAQRRKMTMNQGDA